MCTVWLIPRKVYIGLIYTTAIKILLDQCTGEPPAVHFNSFFFRGEMGKIIQSFGFRGEMGKRQSESYLFSLFDL